MTEKISDTDIAAWMVHNPSLSQEVFRKDRMWLLAKGVLILSLLANFYQSAHPRHGAVIESRTDNSHSVLPLLTLNTPINTQPIVKSWVAKRLVQAFTLDFSVYQDQLEEIRPNFTPAGWLGFMDAINADFLPTVLGHKYRVTAVVCGPVVMPQDPPAHATSWTYQVPMILTFSIGSTNQSRQVLVEVRVVRQDSSSTLLGRGIDSIKFI